MHEYTKPESKPSGWTERHRTKTSDDSRRQTRVLSRRALLAAAVGTGTLLAASPRGRAHGAPIVRVAWTATEVGAGATVEATLTISEIPNGLSGLLGEAHVSDSSVAEITGASFPDSWALTQEPDVSEDGSSVNLVTADLYEEHTAGDTDVELVTLELEGRSGGEVLIELDRIIEDADGNFYEFDLQGEPLVVDGGEAEPVDTGGDDGGGSEGEGERESESEDDGPDSEESDDETEEDDSSEDEADSNEDGVDSSDVGDGEDDEVDDGDENRADDASDGTGADASPLPGAGIGPAIAGFVGGVGYLLCERIRRD